MLAHCEVFARRLTSNYVRIDVQISTRFNNGEPMALKAKTEINIDRHRIAPQRDHAEVHVFIIYLLLKPLRRSFHGCMDQPIQFRSLDVNNGDLCIVKTDNPFDRQQIGGLLLLFFVV